MNRYIFDIRLKYRIIRHIILFIGTVLLFTFVLFYQDKSKSLSESLMVTLINSVFFFGYAYIVLFLLIPEFLLKNKIGWFMLLLLLVGTALSALKFAVSDEIFYASIAPENFQPGSMKGLRFMLVNTKDMTFIVALFCVAKFTKDYVFTESQRKKLEVQNREARQRLLQSQLNPHFLFNTINNLYALSLLQPEKTTEITEKVQQILRYIVEQSRHNFVQLTEEVDLAENYLSLEKLRYGNRLKVDFKKKGELSTWKIPPMVLFFLIENCIKHGSSPDMGAPWLFISIESHPENLWIKAANSKPNNGRIFKGERNIGNGLQNLKNRLAILYPSKGYSIQIDDREKEFSILLQLKKELNEMGSKSYR
ncbi:sensor histidine kinase [Mariniphaga sp.]|uniref:sensor histidine kinase n=1 Tax=Mariniphaga sp. TaxID=1954475 RepID=UPI0035693CA7